MSRAEEILTTLATQRMDLAQMEADYHAARVEGFFQSDETTVKGMEFFADYSALNLHRDLTIMRARVRSLEDQLKVALWDPMNSNG